MNKVRPIVSGCLLLAALAFSNCSRRSTSPAPLPGKSTFEGVVLQDSNGGPVGGAVVLLCRDAMMGVGCSKQVGQTTTDVNGLYSFRDIPPGEYVPAVRVSKQAVFVMQKQTLGKVIAEAVKYTVAPGQTLVVPDLRLDREPEKLDEPSVKLVYPVASASISDPHPTLNWEPVAGAKYFAALSRVDGKESSDVMLTDHPFQEIETNSITVRKELDDGLYEWIVYVSIPSAKEVSVGDRKATAYFSIAKGPAPNR